MEDETLLTLDQNYGGFGGYGGLRHTCFINLKATDPSWLESAGSSILIFSILCFTFIINNNNLFSLKLQLQNTARIKAEHNGK